MKHRLIILAITLLTLAFLLPSPIGKGARGEGLSPSVPLPDLDVTFIERQPMYSAYCVEYRWGEVPGMPGRPFLCPGTENERRWPEPGEVVTFTAHVANKGDLASPAATYSWLIDGAVVETGALPVLAPGEMATAVYHWP